MRTIIFSDKFTPCLAAKIKEQGTLASILGKRSIASLFCITFIFVPHGINSRFHNCRARLCYTSTQKASASNSKFIVFTDATMVSAIEKFFRLTELAFCKLDLPCRSRFKRRFVFVVVRIRHVYNDRIAIVKDTPTRDRSTFDVKLDKVRTRRIEIANIHCRLSGNTFQARAERHTLTVRRNFWMISINLI